MYVSLNPDQKREVVPKTKRGRINRQAHTDAELVAWVMGEFELANPPHRSTTARLLCNPIPSNVALAGTLIELHEIARACMQYLGSLCTDGSVISKVNEFSAMRT